MDKLQIVAQSPLYNHAPCISHVLRRLAVKIWRRQGCPSATSLFVRFGARTLERLAAGSNLWTEWDTTTYRYSYSRVQEPRLSPVCSSFSVCWHIPRTPRPERQCLYYDFLFVCLAHRFNHSGPKGLGVAAARSPAKARGPYRLPSTARNVWISRPASCTVKKLDTGQWAS